MRREFEKFGAIKKIVMVQDTEGKQRGYAFIEYEHERDMHGEFQSISAVLKELKNLHDRIYM